MEWVKTVLLRQCLEPRHEFLMFRQIRVGIYALVLVVVFSMQMLTVPTSSLPF